MTFPYEQVPDEPGVPGATYGQMASPEAPTPTAVQLGSTPATQDPADPWAGYEDYFGFDERERWTFPDGKQWIEFKKLTEGDRAKFLKATRSDVHLNQQTKEARVAFDQSGERKALLLHSLTNWHMVHIQRNPDGTRTVTPVPFPVERSGTHSPGGKLAQWIDNANPAVLAELEKAIRKANPWLLNEMTVEQLDKEIADLQELREKALEREAREKTFPAAS